MFLLNMQKRARKTTSIRKTHEEDAQAFPRPFYQESQRQIQMWSSDYSWLYYTVLVGILPSERQWDDVTWLRPCSSVLQKQCCEPKMAELQEVCRKDPLVTWWCSHVSPPMCPVACTNINQIMFFLLGWVNILNNITIILQRGYLGSTDRHCKHTIENRSS